MHRYLGKNKSIFEKLDQACLFLFYCYWTQCCGFVVNCFAYYFLKVHLHFFITFTFLYVKTK
jgi:hypothetical protein